MTRLLKLAIVGRPNVGKSALFNRICNQRIAIVDEAEGVTRDRLYAESEFFGRPFQVIDTGGIDPRSRALFNDEVKAQAEIAIEEADTLVMVVDATTGPTALDHEVARILLRKGKPVCLAVNKIDDIAKDHLIYDFLSLGITRMVAVSAAQSRNVADLLEVAFENVAPPTDEADAIPSIKIAIVGRPNVGKSSLVNGLLDEQRCIVSPIPGTTRDSIDISFTHENETYTLIDTAGIRKKGSEHEVVEKFAAIRTDRAIDRSDICLLILDVQQGLTTHDKKIANTIEEAGKGCILLFNKWDLVKGFRMEHCMKAIEEEVPFLKHCPKLCISATTGRNLEKIIELVKAVDVDTKRRIPTPQLNDFCEIAMQKRPAPRILGKRLRVYYMTQVDVQPPKFIVFLNYPHLMTDAYKKYLYNQFREAHGFGGVPLIMHLKGKHRSQKDATKAEHQEKIQSHGAAEPECDDLDDEVCFIGGDDDDDESFADVDESYFVDHK